MASTMIAKVAKVQALREAFPAQLGAMYTQEEKVVDVSYEENVSHDTIIQSDPINSEPEKTML